MRGKVEHDHGRPRKSPGGSPHTHRVSAHRPYRLIVSDDPCKTLGQGEVRYFKRIVDAANAFAKAEQPFKQLVYDDGCEARFLNRNEQWMLESVCRVLGLDVEERDYRAEGTA
jgi:hypothetical protein